MSADSRPGSPSAAPGEGPPADPSVSPANTIRRAIMASLSVTGAPGGYGVSYSHDDYDAAHAALDALLAVGERDKAEIARLTEKRAMALALVKAAQAHVAELEAQGERDRQHIERLTAVVELVPSVGRLRWLAAILDAMDERGWPEGLTYTFDDGVSVPLLEYPDLDTPGDAVQRDLRALADARAVLADKEDAANGRDDG